MKNKYVELGVALDAAIENIGNLGIDGDAVLIPCTCSDYYLADKLSKKINIPLHTLADYKPDDPSKTFVISVSWAYECEHKNLKDISDNNSKVLVGVFLTSKTLDEARKEFPEFIILSVLNPAVTYLDRGMHPEDYVRSIIDYIGEDPNRPGVVDTPKRVVKMWNEIYGGYLPENKPKITTFCEEDSINSRDIIFDKGEAWSNCEHHMAPFKIEYCFAYIPNPKGKLLGLSKISRVVRYCSQKMQLQERIGTDVVNMIVEELTSGVGQQNPPLGVAIMIKGAHSCKTMRGVKTPGCMISTYTWGCFEEHNPQREEFMSTAKEMLGSGSVIFG